MMSEGSSSNSIKRETLTQMFNSDVCKIFKSICFIEYLCWLLLKKQKDTSKCIFLTTWWNSESNSLVIKQKGESQNGCFKKTKHVEFSEKKNISYPLIRIRTCFVKFGVFRFRETPVLRFSLLPYYWLIFSELFYWSFNLDHLW